MGYGRCPRPRRLHSYLSNSRKLYNLKTLNELNESKSILFRFMCPCTRKTDEPEDGVEFSFPNKMVKIVGKNIRCVYRLSLNADQIHNKLNFCSLLYLPFRPAALKYSRMTGINKGKKYVFLEDLDTMNQNKVHINKDSIFV